MAAVFVGRHGPLIVSDPDANISFAFEIGENLTVEYITFTPFSYHPPISDKLNLKECNKPADVPFFNSATCEPGWRPFFTNLLSTASSNALLSINYISRDTHDQVVAFLFERGFLDTRIEYPRDVYN